jgi:hypothetical protein
MLTRSFRPSVPPVEVATKACERIKSLQRFRRYGQRATILADTRI